MDRTAIAATEAEAVALSGSQAFGQPQSPDRYPLCLKDRHFMGRFAAGTGLRLGNELLATPS
jgi:hypothetical protein